MSGRWIGSRRGRGWITGLALSATLVLGPVPAWASEARSTPEDRQRFVSIARSLEQAPLKTGARDDRAWALEWLVNAPDVAVTVCTDSLAALVQGDYFYAGEITFQEMFSMGAFAIEHPEAANDPNAQQLAGVEGALNAYRSILRDRPDAKSPALENLLEVQSRGELPDHVRKALVSCSTEK